MIPVQCKAKWDTTTKGLCIPSSVQYTEEQKKDLECIISSYAKECGMSEVEVLDVLQSAITQSHEMYQYLSIGILVSMGLYRTKSRAIVASVFARSEDGVVVRYQKTKRMLFVKRIGPRKFFERVLDYIPDGKARWDNAHTYKEKKSIKQKTAHPQIEIVKVDTQKFEELRSRVYVQLKTFPVHRSSQIILSSIESFSGIHKEKLVLAQGKRSNGSRVRTKRVYSDLRKIFFSAMKEVYGNEISLIFLASFFTPKGEMPNHSNVQLSIKDHKFLIENDKYYMDTFFIFLTHISFILDAYLLHEQEFARLDIDIADIETRKKEVFRGIILSARKNLVHVHTENKREVVIV